jgi:spermidine synthase
MMRRVCLYCLFFLSGASALIYEIAWQRSLNLIFGVSSLSVSAVLAAFMGGLALGGMLFGRLADRARHPLRAYALLEAGIAITGLLVPFGLSAVAVSSPGLQAHLPAGRWSFALLRFIFSLAILGLPTTFLGATLPFMARLMIRPAATKPSVFSLVYAVNTLGAIVGAALTGLLLLRVLGMKHTLWIAASLNGLTASIAALMARRTGSEADVAVPVTSKNDTAGSPIGPVLFCAALTGALSLGLEVIWSRILGVLTSNSAYGFALVLVVALSGLFLGSLLNAWWARRPGSPWRRLACCQALLAGFTLFAPPYFHVTPNWLVHLCDSASPAKIFLGELLLTAAALFVPMFLSGMSLPLLVGLVSELRDVGQQIGRLYALNALGCATGPFLIGFILIPVLGIHGALSVCFALAVALAVVGWWQAAPAAGLRQILVAAIAVSIVATAWLLVPGGEYLKSPIMLPRQLLYYAEGDNATVAVIQETSGAKSILVDGQPVAGTGGTSIVDQKMLAHLPLLLHPAPRRALTVGFGSGGTSYSMSLHGIDVDCVEIEACVPAAADHFASENHGILQHPQYRLVVDDARSWLRVAPEPYDVIVTDCTNIQYRSNADLYTTNYFDLMHQRLSADGVAAAWVPANGIDSSDLKTLLRSFRSVFPHTSVWYMNTLPTDFLIVIGTPRPLRLDLSSWRERMQAPAIYADMAAVGLADECTLAYTLLTAENALAGYLGEGPLNSDDRPILAYSTYGAGYRSTIAGNLIELLASRVDPAEYIAGAVESASLLRRHAARNEVLFGHLAHWTGDEATAQARYLRARSLLPDDAAIARLVYASRRSQADR